MRYELEFEDQLLNNIIGGVSALDSPRLFVKTRQEAYAFLKSYGFDLFLRDDLEKLLYFYRRSVVLIKEKLLNQDEEIPELFRVHADISFLRKLLLLASEDPVNNPLQNWAMAIIRVMHVFIHAEFDLFNSFAQEIQKQILVPIEDCIGHESQGGVKLAHPFSGDEILLADFQIKPFKTSQSSVIKALAKADYVAMKVLDKVGFRFITRSLVDSFKVVLFLAEKNLINFAHVMPEQSSNNLCPLNLFLDEVRELRAQGLLNLKSDSLEERLQKRIALAQKQENNLDSQLLRKPNAFSHSDYRFIKFISRKLIRIKQDEQREFSFFYPFEVQIVDQRTHLENESGGASHDEYKERQRQGARQRVFKNMLIKKG